MTAKYHIKLRNKNTGEELEMYNNIFDPRNGVAFFEIDKNWELVFARQFAGLQDKNKKYIYEDNKVLFEGKEYTIKYFENYGMFGLSDGGEKPVGRRGSSTKYEPYILGECYQKRMEIIA